MDMQELVSRTARNAVRYHVTGLAVGAIREYWENEGFAAVPDLPARDTSVRRGTFDSYAAAVDWTDHRHVERALRVFEALLRRINRDSGDDSTLSFDEVSDALVRDGYELGPDLRIRARHLGHLQLHLKDLSDPSGIQAELERIRRSVAEHPDDAIGAAKQLIEATAKIVLKERGEPLSDHDDLADLVKRSQQSLLLHPRQSPPLSGPDAAGAVKRVLGGLSSIALGVTELRNQYGAGHGRLSAPTGLSPRHARLAVNAASTWCEVMLETLADPSAPWRSASA
ncbi:abortive infection family protein [Nonomuraea sp. WAC 01424]|uniref:abortive infection family protein n=1 Tax=Nonomuraea sp. WAC 01424 TaxID=2203200 RepID=UPI001C8C3406|nr:abortive infection family protein [Nonomuraea sp. WAC 01424]